MIDAYLWEQRSKINRNIFDKINNLLGHQIPFILHTIIARGFQDCPGIKAIF